MNTATISVLPNGSVTTLQKAEEATTASTVVNTPIKVNVPSAEDAFFQLAKNSSLTFNSLKMSIKMNGDMFAFGEPTVEIMELITKVYHENIIRVLSKDISEKVDEVQVEGKELTKYACMLGVLHAKDTDGKEKIFVTISESPAFDAHYNGETDILYKEKKKMVLTLLGCANIQVNFPEQTDDETKKQFPGFGGTDYLGPTQRWRETNTLGWWEKIKKYDQLRSQINSNQNLKNDMFLDSNFFWPELKKNETDMYDRIIRNKKVEVQWVDSIHYLRKRIIEVNQTTKKITKYAEKTFRPFKKYKINKKTQEWSAECNNGHLCTESKLFAYAHHKKLEPISFVAYWIQNKLPPHHIIRGYSYRTDANTEEIADANTTILQAKLNAQLQKETKLLNTLTNRCLKVLMNTQTGATVKYNGFFQDLYKLYINRSIAAEQADKFIFYKLRRIVQPAAVACPGCFANIEAYKKGDMVNWNSRDCYVKRKGIPATTFIKGGGKRMTKRKLRKNKKGTRKTH